MSKSLFPLVAKRIDSIPTLPLSLSRLLEATEGDGGPSGDVARLIEADPALTAKVLKVINSPFYGLRFKISTLPHAVAMLGHEALRNLARGIASFPEAQSEESALEKKLVVGSSVTVCLPALIRSASSSPS